MVRHQGPGIDDQRPLVAQVGDAAEGLLRLQFLSVSRIGQTHFRKRPNDGDVFDGVMGFPALTGPQGRV